MSRWRGLMVAAVLLAVAGGGAWWTRHRTRLSHESGPTAPAAPTRPGGTPTGVPVQADPLPPVPTLLPSPVPTPGPPPPSPPPRAAAGDAPATESERFSGPARGPEWAGAFAPGESALYDVSWVGFGAGLSAGTAEFQVSAEPPQPPGRLTLSLTAVTAAWVSTFFDARDRFWTVVSPDLLPIEHHQDLREGRRHVMRTQRFDHDARLVRTGSGALTQVTDGATRALGPSTRDPLAAMYFVRTVDWARRPALDMVVADLGLDLRVQVTRGPVESIRAEGRTQPARKLSVRMTYIQEPHPTPSASVWLSEDARRLPLVADVDTDVGLFRMALTRYVAGRATASPDRRRGP